MSLKGIIAIVVSELQQFCIWIIANLVNSMTLCSWILVPGGKQEAGIWTAIIKQLWHLSKL